MQRVPSMGSAVLLFARAPELESKRLGLSLAQTRRVHAALLKQSLAVASRCGARLVVALDGESDGIPQSALLLAQRGDTFEQRLIGALEQVRDAGFERIVVIGTDTPGLTDVHVRKACEANTWVVGPSLDGGAYLFGLPAAELDVFRGLPWRTSRLREALTSRLSSLGRSVAELEALRDIDDSSDVDAAWEELNSLCQRHLGEGLGLAPAQSVQQQLEPDRLRLQGTAPQRPQAPPASR